MSNVVIYTAVIGGTDKLIPPRVKQEVPTIAFCHPSQKAKGWEVRPAIENLPKDIPGHAASISRWYKVLSHVHFPEVDYAIWVDGTYELTGDLTKFIPFEEDWVSYRHPHQRGLYNELDAIITFKRDYPKTVERLRTRYTRMGIPNNIVLTPCGIFWRHHTEQMKHFNEAWWKEICDTDTRRDMPAWGVQNHRTPLRTRFLRGSNTNNEFAQWNPHLKRVPSVF